MSRSWLWSLFAVVLLGIPAAAALLGRPRGLPRYGQVPAFTLTDQTGQPLSDRDLRGKLWVADFIFTHCPQACPRLTGEMAKLQPYLRNRAAAGRVRLVSITVDPVNDTPERLAVYAAGFQADPALWKFLTGPAQAIEAAVERGFKVGMGREPDGQGGFNILHGTRLVLVDVRGTIRGYYDIDDALEMKRLRADLGTLLERGGS